MISTITLTIILSTIIAMVLFVVVSIITIIIVTVTILIDVLKICFILIPVMIIGHLSLRASASGSEVHLALFTVVRACAASSRANFGCTRESSKDTNVSKKSSQSSKNQQC